MDNFFGKVSPCQGVNATEGYCTLASQCRTQARRLGGAATGDFVRCSYKNYRLLAIEDGEFVDVTERAKKAGFKIPVVLTQDAWERCVEMTEVARMAGLTENSRLANLLSTAYTAAAQEPDAEEVKMRLYVVTNSPDVELITLKMRREPGDEGDPEFTIMLPEED